MPLSFASVVTHLGTLRVGYRKSGIVTLDFSCGDQCADTAAQAVLPSAWAGAICRAALGKPFSCPPLMPQGTDFQLAVWQELRRIPCGETRTYGEIATAIGRAGAARAVGAACGANPVLLLIPCHRVVASDGGLGGFSAGLELKKALLGMEARVGSAP